MPPKCRFIREQIVQAALNLTRREGIGAVTARAVGAELNSSSKVVFGLFESMEELQREVIHAADARYQARIRQEMAAGRYPPYKASGMAYIGFAKEEPELFRLLFMRDRTRETQAPESAETQMLTGMLRDSMGLSEESARIFHLEMWICVHGIATMLATQYLEWDWEIISRMMSDLYDGLRRRYQEENRNECH